VEFEPTIPAFEQAKTVHASDGAATAIGGAIEIFLANSWASILFPTHSFTLVFNAT
jgi:hypothetical protein